MKRKINSKAHHSPNGIFSDGVMTINVRSAKDRFSKLLELVSKGEEIIITSDGKPKAKLVPFRPKQKPFHVDWSLLKPKRSSFVGKLSEELIREDRDARY